MQSDLYAACACSIGRRGGIYPDAGQRAVVHFQRKALDFVGIAAGGFGENVAVNVLAEHVVRFVFCGEADGLPFFAVGNNLPSAELQGDFAALFALLQPPVGFAPFVHAFQLARTRNFVVRLVFISVGIVPNFAASCVFQQ